MCNKECVTSRLLSEEKEKNEHLSKKVAQLKQQCTYEAKYASRVVDENISLVQTIGKLEDELKQLKDEITEMQKDMIIAHCEAQINNARNFRNQQKARDTGMYDKRKRFNGEA